MTGSITRLCLCCVIVSATAGAAEARRSRPAMPDGPPAELYVPGYDRIVVGSPKVVCGMNGCLEVGPGCQARLRRIGRGETAVVLCDGRR
jgi:hypothetical protein